MDEKTTRTILKLLPQFRLWQIEEYIMLSSYAALIYYYMTTFREEVSQIWPQKRTLGKILFLTTRYAAIGSMTAMLLTNWRNYMVISIPGCQAIVYIQNIVTEVCRTSAEATLWLCLYALLEGKRRYFWILIVLFLSFSIPILALELHNVLTQKAVERSILDDLLGYPCNYEPGLYPSHESVANYISFARTALALIAGLVTIVRRYRKQNHNLIRVIKREGGFYYISALIFRFLGSISMTPGSAVSSISSQSAGERSNPQVDHR
ncbi:hypothetical protein FA13DRAFT_1741653 [Coprinellus micaceus]|uniref:DUF6533 domain-containing protein n=1 Tax=Coprinellus micaceus TaxID=71717 RepID=A0A4Y7SJ81_COPMI|nr:hypothetical protein FA13DRAFT_1741653 [Coprinellus micaceus]